jgi:hypothetical protein
MRRVAAGATLLLANDSVSESGHLTHPISHAYQWNGEAGRHDIS